MTTQLMQQEDEYKETELGSLPRNWQVKKLGDVTHLVMGQSPPGETYNTESKGMPFLQGKAEFGSLHPTHIKYTTKPAKIAEKGSVLLSVRAPVGDVNIADMDYCIGRGLASLSMENNQFLFYLLTYFKPSIEKEGTGSTFKAINKPKLKSILVTVPPLFEQKNIAYVLSIIKSAMEKTGNVINSLKDLKKSLMKHLFTYGAISFEDADKVKMKETEIGNVPENWKVKELKDIATLQRGKDLPKQEWKRGTVPIIGSSGIMGYHKEAVCEGPGVITGRSGSIGKVTYVEENYWPHNTALYVKDFHENDPRFVYYLMQTLDFEKYATGVSVPTLNRNFIHMAKKAVPMLPVQQEIAFVLHIIDSNIGYEEDKKKALEQLFKSTLYDLMSAKIRVNNFGG